MYLLQLAKANREIFKDPEKFRTPKTIFLRKGLKTTKKKHVTKPPIPVEVWNYVSCGGWVNLSHIYLRYYQSVEFTPSGYELFLDKYFVL